VTILRLPIPTTYDPDRGFSEMRVEVDTDALLSASGILARVEALENAGLPPDIGRAPVDADAVFGKPLTVGTTEPARPALDPSDAPEGYVAVATEGECFGCDFASEGECTKTATGHSCAPCGRKDKRNVIFKATPAQPDAHAGTFLTFGDGSVKITGGSSEGLPSVVLEPGHVGHAPGERGKEPDCKYWTRPGDVVLRFRNAEGMKVLIEELQEIQRKLNPDKPARPDADDAASRDASHAIGFRDGAADMEKRRSAEIAALSAQVSVLKASLDAAREMGRKAHGEADMYEQERDRLKAELAAAKERAEKAEADRNETARGSLRYRESLKAELDAARADLAATIKAKRENDEAIKDALDALGHVEDDDALRCVGILSRALAAKHPEVGAGEGK
jgi:hypothetical protein